MHIKSHLCLTLDISLNLYKSCPCLTLNNSFHVTSVSTTQFLPRGSLADIPLFSEKKIIKSLHSVYLSSCKVPEVYRHYFILYGKCNVKILWVILWMPLFSWVPIFVDWTKITHSWGSNFVAILFSFIIDTEKSLFRGYWNLWIGPSTKTTKIGTPWKLSHPQYL